MAPLPPWKISFKILLVFFLHQVKIVALRMERVRVSVPADSSEAKTSRRGHPDVGEMC